MINGTPTPSGYAKAVALRRALARGLAAWQASPRNAPRYLSPALLEAALRYLQAGYRLSEAQLILILRSALAHEVGVVTALSFQLDGEAVASVVVDALVDERKPLSLATLWRMQRARAGNNTWEARAAEELLMLLPRVGLGLRAHVESARYQLETGLPILEEIAYQDYLAGSTAVGLPPTNVPPPDQVISFAPVQVPASHRLRQGDLLWDRRLLAVIAGLVVVGIAIGYSFLRLPATGHSLATIEGGTYRVGDPQTPGGAREVFVDHFRMMTHEVTNGDYRRCVEAGACPMPVSPSSRLRQNSFLDPAFAMHPVVQVRWRDAVAYCAWRGMRLPSAVEWEVAASFSPLTGLQYRYPWGERFEPLFANHAGAGYGDSQQAGIYHPHGDSPTGLRDMAGNVAEWTASPAGTDPVMQVVKGGSFADEPALLAVYAERFIEPDAASVWLGFRCAV